jgi:hypothetical protein
MKMVCLILLILTVGCHAPSDFASLERPRVLSGDPNMIWQAAKSELILRGFKIDRLDQRTGRMETYPLASKQWFEFWRNDVVDSDSLAESSLQTVRRKIRLTLALDPSGTSRLDCQVLVERLASHPDATRRIIRARDIFASTSGRMPTLQSWADRRKYDQIWIPLGRDEPLETVVLEDIEKSLTLIK